MLLAVAVFLVLLAVHHLDAPWLKLRLQRWVSSVIGFEVDWRSVRVDLGAGGHLEGLEVKSPPAFRDIAPDLLKADAVDVDASIFGGLRAIRITSADVTLVQEGNRKSWEVTGTAVPPAAPGPGLSLVLAELFSKPPPIPKASLEGASLTWIRVDPGHPIERVRMSGLSLSLQGWSATLGTAATPVHIDTKYEVGENIHTALLDVHASASAERRGLQAVAEIKVARQNWAPNLSVAKLLSLGIAAKFDTAHQRIDLDLNPVQLLDQTATLKGGVALPDDPAVFPTAHDLDGAVDLQRLASFLAPLKLPLSVDRGALHFRAKSSDEINVEANAGTVVVAGGATTVSLAGASLAATLRPRSAHLLRAQVNGHCTVAAAGAGPSFNEDVRLDLRAEEVAKDFSRARLRGTVAGPWGELAFVDDHRARTDAAHITFHLPSLALLRPLLPKTPWPVDWGSASATGSIDVHAQLGSERPEIHQTSEISVQNLAARLPAGPLVVRSVSANVRSEGTDLAHHADVELRMAGVQWRGGTASDQKLDASLDFVAATPRFHLILKTEGALASASADLQTRFDRARRELVSEFTASASHLSGVALLPKEAPGVARFDLANAEATLSGRARLQGIVLGFDRNGAPRFERRPLVTARGEAEVQGTVQNARWLAEEQSAAISSVRFEARAKGNTHQATVDGRLDVRGAKYARGETSYSASPISLRFVTALNPRSGEANAQGELALGQVLVSEDFGYPLEGLKLSFSLERQTDGVVRLPKATLENVSAGTTLELRGGLALEEIPAKLSARGSLTQDLSKVWRNPDVFSGQGRAELRFAVESSDLTVFHASGALTLDRVALRMPRWGLVAEEVDSEIPLLGAFERNPRGIELIQARRPNPYSALRFADQHPLFSRRSYLSIRRLVTPDFTLESFAGNVKVDHNLIAIDQMEMAVRGGHLAGQCLLDTDPKALRAKAVLRATGILSSSGEPFDGNAALSVSLRDRSVDGRAEILRIGRRHLLDLLDLLDPYHATPAFNRVRRVLAFGYPDRVKITFDRGFANAHITFGGLASLVKLDDLRGIPMEPLIDKYLVKEEP